MTCSMLLLAVVAYLSVIMPFISFFYGAGWKTRVTASLSCWSLLNHVVPLQLNKDIKPKKAAAVGFFFCLLKGDVLAIPSFQTFSYPIVCDSFTRERKEDAKNIIEYSLIVPVTV